MKLTPFFVVGLTALVAGPALLPLQAEPAPEAGLAVQGDPYNKWRQDFKRAMEINEKQEMMQLVRRNDVYAVYWIIRTCESISSGSNDELETFMANLREAWESAMKTDFAKKVYEYFALLEPHMLRERTKLKETYDDLYKRLMDNAEKKDGPTYELVGKELRGLAKGFEEVGDHYWSSQCWSLAALCYNEDNREADANLFKQTECYREMLAARDRVELQDKLYKETEQTYKYLKAQGYDQDEAAAKEKGGPGPGAIVEAQPILVSGWQFELLDDIGGLERPVYPGDELYPIWSQISFSTKGSRTKFGAMETSPQIIREGSSKVSVDADGDGTGEVEVPLTGNVEAVEVTLGQGEEARPWGFLCVMGNTQDTYQGIQFNLAPSDDVMSLYIAGAASMVSELEGEPIRIIDDNMDGLYGSPPKTWEFIGMSKGHYQVDMDSVVIGKEKRARPWSEFQQVGDQWYHFENAGWGKELKVTPVELETGTIKVKYKGPKAEWLVLQGGGKFENTYIDVSGGKAVDVPKGYWKLAFGVVQKGKGKQALKALIVGGDDTQWKVDAGETTQAELGAPFSFVFEHKVEETSIEVDGYSVAIVGQAGERYQRLWNCVARPEVSYRKVGSKRGSKPEKMKVLGSSTEMEDIEKEKPGSGWRSAWFPLDITIPKKKGETEVQVQLIEKKNKLFGKIESEWRD